MDLVLPYGVTEIGEEAFFDGRIGHITIPASVGRIGENAFARNSGIEITFRGTEERWSQIGGEGAVPSDTNVIFNTEGLYDITINETAHGTVTAPSAQAAEGDLVLLTITPDEGYDLDTLQVTSGGENVETVRLRDYPFDEHDGRERHYTFIMPAGGVTITATLREADDYRLWVGGEHVTSAHLSGAGWNYDPAESTLTLSGAQITDYCRADDARTANIFTHKDLTIVLSGSNVVRGGYRAIHAYLSSVSIRGGRVTAQGVYSGIQASGAVTITDSDVTALGSSARSNGIYAGGEEITITNSRVTASGGIGVYALRGKITISDSSVHASTTRDDYYGIYARTGISIDGAAISRPADGAVGSYSNGYSVLDGDGPARDVLIKPAGPEFMTQSLVLSGKLGLNFFLDLSDLTDEEKAASYMSFSISGKGSRTEDVPFDDEKTNESGVYHGFTFYVSSIQMADTVTAVYHYTRNGTAGTIEKTYSVLQYLLALDGAAGFDDETMALVHAIADYGHYTQRYLAAANGLELGRDYAVMDKWYTESFDADAIKDAVKDMKLEKEGDGLANASVTYTLSLKTETTLILWITPDDGYTVSAFSDGSNTYQAVKSGSRYKITIPNIPAHALGTPIRLTGSVTNGGDGGEITIELSPMSYVYSVLNMPYDDQTFGYESGAWDAVCALYKYYDAARNYNN